MSAMRVSAQGRDFIRQWEGVRDHAYQDAIGLWTIGVGHLLTRSQLTSGKILIGGEMVEWREGLSSDQIDWLLADDLASAEAAVGSLKIPLHQRQFDALVAFAFNVGEGAFRASSLYRELNGIAERVEAITVTQLRRWVYAGGKKIDGLINRREAELLAFTGRVDGGTVA